MQLFNLIFLDLAHRCPYCRAVVGGIGGATGVQRVEGEPKHRGGGKGKSVPLGCPALLGPTPGFRENIPKG